MPLHPVAAKMLADSAFGGLAKPDIETARDVIIEVRDTQIRGRLYRASNDGVVPLIVYYHGGGWLLGSIDSHDVLTRRLALSSGFAVLSVDYRRGPESFFPVAVNDAVDAVTWAVKNAQILGIDPKCVAVAGDSAGGNLATVAAAVLRDEGGPHLAMQILIYPVTTCDLDRGFDMKYEGHILYRDEMLWHQENYLSSSDQATDPRVSPLLADLHGLPPAVVVIAECDPIRPQSELYIDALKSAGVRVSVYDAPTLVHGFFGLDELFPEAADAMDFVAKELKGLME
jgi:acetyl esterase